MIQAEKTAAFKEILAHITEQRVRAKLTDKPFELGILTDKKPSQILSLFNDETTMKTLRELGMTEFKWNDDALRSELRLSGEHLTFSICRPR